MISGAIISTPYILVFVLVANFRDPLSSFARVGRDWRSTVARVAFMWLDTTAVNPTAFPTNFSILCLLLDSVRLLSESTARYGVPVPRVRT